MEASDEAAVEKASTPAPINPMDDGKDSGDICRVCRCEGTADKPLFHPCICTGSIKFIHQECLVQWLRYSKKEFCELCNHRFSFTPIYSPDMPKRIPLRLVFSGLVGTVGRAVKFWLHYTLVALAWLGVVPLTSCRIFRTLFTGSVSSIFSIPFTVFSSENIVFDILLGGAVVTLTLLTFIGLVWLREQILHGGGPVWLEPEVPPPQLQDPEEEQNNVPGDDQPQEDPDVGLAVPAAPQAPQPDANNAHHEFSDEDEGEEEDEENDQEDEEDLLAPIEDAEDDGGAAPELLDQVGEEQQWAPMEWDRAAEELTWERLLGLDGSLMFLEHVFWVVSLNSLFILVFAFCPYHIGHFTLSGLTITHLVEGIHFEGLMIAMVGYLMIGLILVVLHTLASCLGFKRSSRALGLCYLVVKVALLLVSEILVFPVICGWWLDICSLSLFDASLRDRLNSFHTTPWTSIFVHWLIGMVYVFYFASFIILLREILRPGVLWFLRNLNDPDFNPIQEMIHLPLTKHIRRYCASLIMFGTSIFVMLYCPSRIIRATLPQFLPYTTQSNEGNVDELAMELLLLLVIIPAVQDQNHTREWLKWLVSSWCLMAAWLLDLRSYMFGDMNVQNPTNINNPDNEENNEEGPNAAAPEPQEQPDDGGQAGQNAILQSPLGPQGYVRPKYFAARIGGLLALMVASWLFMSLCTMVVPVWIGRQIFGIWTEEGERVYELFTSATGCYVCLLIARGVALLLSWLRQGLTTFGIKLKEWGIIIIKSFVAMLLLAGLIPFMFGLLLDLVVLTPARIPLHQSPLYFLWQDWALGAMYTKITVALTIMGPDWWLKAAVEQMYHDGLRNINLTNVIKTLVLPSVRFLGLCLAGPYVFSHCSIMLIMEDPKLIVIIQRRIYPFTLLACLFSYLLVFQFKQFTKLVEHIKNDRYLVGRRLVNYYHNTEQEEQPAPEAAPQAAN